MNKIKVRPIHIKEIPDLLSLFREAVFSIPDYSARLRRIFLQKYSRKKVLKRLKQKSALCLVAVIDGQLAGFCWGSSVKSTEDGVYWMNWIGVSKKFRRRGVARQLMTTLEDIVRQRKFHKIWMNIDPQNTRSQKTFESLGYHKVTLIRNHWYGLDALIWDKELK